MLLVRLHNREIRSYFFVPNNTLTLVSPFSFPTVTTTVRFVAVSSAEIMPPDALSVLPEMLAVIPKPASFRFWWWNESTFLAESWGVNWNDPPDPSPPCMEKVDCGLTPG